MDFCKFATIDLGDGRWHHVCTRCDIERTTTRPNHMRQCNLQGAVPSAPSLATKVANVSKAAAKWIAAGRPQRSPERIAQIFDEHCSRCPMLVDAACRLCGCPIQRVSNYRNKLFMATEGCPKLPPEFPPDVQTQS